ncbi:MAG: ABC transporter substrate-binding protein [Clostridiales bacterium]|nr:ABC transporter substrate-binding protein [Clostridiales bacterium]
MKRNKKAIIASLLLGTAAAGLAGCAKQASQPADNVKKHINVGYYWLTSNLDYSDDYNGWEVSIMGIGEALVKLNQKLEVEPCIADKWTNVDDKTWEFHIRDNVKFSNGKKVDAEACKASIERSLKKNTRADGYLKVDSITAEGQKLTIKTKEPNAALVNNISEPLFDIIDVSAGDEALEKAPIGTGPYTVRDFKPEKSIELERNKNYWDGEVGLDSISVTYIADESARVMAMQSGEVDMTNYITYQSIKNFSDTSRYTISSVAGPRVNVAYMNNASTSPLGDINLRRALSYAIDRDQYAKLIGGSAAHGVFSDGTPYGNEKLKGYTYDLDKARSMLDEAGYKDINGDGIREGKDGAPLTLQFYGKSTSANSTTEADTLAVAIQSDFKKVGIDMKINNAENLSDITKTGKFDMYIYALNSAPTGDPQVWLQTMYTLGEDSLQTSSTANVTKYHNDKMDQVVNKLKTTFAIKDRYKLAQEGSQILLDDAADLYITNNMLTMISSSKLEGCVQPVCDYYMITKDIKLKK